MGLTFKEKRKNMFCYKAFGKEMQTFIFIFCRMLKVMYLGSFKSWDLVKFIASLFF